MNFEQTFIGRPNTIAAYKSLFNHHIKDLTKDAPWESWDDNKTIICLREWEKQGLSKKTRQILLRLLSRYSEFNGGPKINTRHFARMLERGEQQEDLTVLNKTEAAALMSACAQTEPKFYPILLLALHAGLRRGEIFGLRCGDIDMLKGQIKVAHNYDGPTKSGKTRFVPMSTELVNEMIKARNLLLRPSNVVVFEKQNPNPKLRKVCSQAGVRPLRFHDLRHTFATLALESGVSPRQVANWLGHSSVTTTLSIYWNLTKNEFNINSFLPGGPK